MALTKRSWQSLPNGSPEQVVAHAAWRRSRGKGPSMPYGNIRRPGEALRAALLEAPPAELEKDEGDLFADDDEGDDDVEF